MAEQRRLGNIQTEVTNVTLHGSALDAETGQSESYSFQLGATAISEGIAFELDQIVASGQSGQRAPGDTAPPFPYHVLRKVAERECPEIPVGGVLTLGCLSLLWNDPAGELVHLFDLYNERVQAGATPDEAVQQIVQLRLPDIRALIRDILAVDIPAMENALQATGNLERGLIRILGRFRQLLARRGAEPLLELSVLDDDGRISFARTRDLLESIPICMVMLERVGSENVLARDTLLSSEISLQPARADDELALLYAAFDFCAVHQWFDGLRPTDHVGEHCCPFYTCCTLRMRIEAPESCRTKPWVAATWTGWPEDQTCWYGAAAKRLPAGTGAI